MALKPTRNIARVVVVLLAVQVVASLVEIPVLLHRIGLLTQIQAGAFVDAARGASANNAVATSSGILGVAFIATIIFWCMWQHSAQANAIELNHGGLRYTPGWAVGWWFIPFANLVKPYQTVSELWSASLRDLQTKIVASRALLPFWWALWLMSNVHIWDGGGSGGLKLGFGISNLAGSPTSTDTLISQDRWRMVSLAFSVSAAILAIAIVRAIDRRQAAQVASWQPQIPPMPGAPEGGMPPPPPMP